MSEYQYYEFLAVDRPLEDRQIDDLRRLSTRAHITPTSFVNTYEWGDFRGNPCALMENYFDAFLYLAKWGTHRLMLRLPPRLLDLKTAQQYCVGEAASVWAEGDQVILDLVSEDEQGDWEDSGEGWLASIIPARAELASGDLRVLYLVWLLCAQGGALEDDVAEPPVPPDLAALTAPLRSLADLLRIDEDLLAVAALASERSISDDRSAVDLARWVENLPVAEKNALLVRWCRFSMAMTRTCGWSCCDASAGSLRSARQERHAVRWASCSRPRRPVAPSGSGSRWHAGSRNAPAVSARLRLFASSAWNRWEAKRNMSGSG